jgi:exopolyphosphatase/guanosine-5'-triphosphate,3'-diphosphate pyrophosphatase
VRNAKNQRGFLDEVFVVCGFHLKVLSEEDEAHFVYQGVINSLDCPKGLIMDIGGGSTQLVYYNRRMLLGHKTIPAGAITLTEMFKDVKTPQERAAKIRAYFYDQIKDIQWLKEIDIEDIRLIGVGGSFRNVGKISRLMQKYPLDLAHNYNITRDKFQEVYDTITTKDFDETMQIKGLSNERADIFPSALAAIDAVFSLLPFESLTISGAGLREGVLFHHAVPSTNERPLTDVLGHSLFTVLKQFGDNVAHAEHVYFLSIQLFKQLKVLHKLPRIYVKVLRAASMLHDAGMRIRFYDHHKHSSYIILNCGLNGVSHKELIMAALVARLHRKSDIVGSEFNKYREILTAEDLDAIRKLGVIVRIAESLDRASSCAIRSINCDVLGDSVIMKTDANGADITLEIKDALGAALHFKKAYGKNLQIL